MWKSPYSTFSLDSSLSECIMAPLLLFPCVFYASTTCRLANNVLHVQSPIIENGCDSCYFVVKIFLNISFVKLFSCFPIFFFLIFLFLNEFSKFPDFSDVFLFSLIFFRIEFPTFPDFYCFIFPIFFFTFQAFQEEFSIFQDFCIAGLPIFFLFFFGFLTWTWGLKGPKLLPDLMYFLCRVGAEFQDVQQVSIRPGHEPSGASHSTLRPENMHENMFLQVPAHPPDRFRKTRFFLLRRFLLRSWYFVRYRRRWICGLSVKQDWNW